MKPLKVLQPVLRWMFRIAIVWIVFERFSDTFFDFYVETAGFYFALSVIVFTFLLIVGGLINNNTLTIISGFVILGVALATIFIDGFTWDKLHNNFILASMGLYFICYGNRN